MDGVNNKNTTYTLTYNANGGEGGPSAATLMGNEYYAIFRADTATPIREGYDFAGWSFTPDGPAEIFADDFFTVTSQNATLYAVWALHETNVVSNDETEANTEPLGVVTSSNNHSNPVVTGGILLPTLLGVGIAAAIVLAVTKSRRPRILSKEYDNSPKDNSDFDF